MKNLEEIQIDLKEKILLLLMPFWTPLIPPLGIACIKSYLQKHGYEVVAVDANQESSLLAEYDLYIKFLREYVPKELKGNFYNITHNVFRNHCMAYQNYTDYIEYSNLVKVIIAKHFFCEISDTQLNTLDEIVKRLYVKLKEYMRELLEKHNPSVVGISVYSGTLPASIFAFKEIKQYNPFIKTIMGGGIFADQLAQGTPDFEAFVNRTTYIDKIIIGEGEEIFLKYLQGHLNESQKVYTLQDNRQEYLNPEAVDVPDFSDFNVQYYPYMATYVSRSCMFQCKFCSETVQWGRFRNKGVEKVVDEFVQLYDKYNNKVFLLGDSLLNPFITDLAEEIIKRDLPFYWDGYLRVDKNVCNIENTLKWRKGGYYRARLGIESGSQRVLNLMDKRITTEQIKMSLVNLAYAGIKTTTYWVVGYPGETEEDFQQTLNIIEEMKDNIWEAECNPFWYYPSAQVGSDDLAKVNGISLLYPEKSEELLMNRTWIVNCEPCREVIYARVRKFSEHCRALGIPNVYTFDETYLADKRWKKLHVNAVPMMTEFRKKNASADHFRNI